MKKITLLIFLMLYALGFSQNAPITFESGGYGSGWTFANFGNGTGPEGYEKVANPSVSGINTSATVGKFTALSTTTAGAAAWAGCESKHAADLGTFKLNYSNCTIKIMVYKSVISDVGIKFSVADGGSTGEIKVANTKINEWEELTFDFSGKIGQATSGAIDQIVFFMDFRDRTDQSISYFDNITFSKSLVAPPVVACDAILTDAQQGSFTVGYKTKFETVGTNVNISFELLDQKDGLVVGLWRETPFEDIPMTNNPVGSKIYTKTITGQTPGDVISYACKFAYAGGQSVTKYIKYEVGSYCDGIKPTSPTAAAATPTAATANVISLFSGGAYTDLAGTNWNPGWGQSTVYEEVLVSGNATKKYSNFNYQGVVLQSPIDVSKMTKLHLDVWSPDCNALKVFLVPTTGAEQSVTVNPSLTGWNSIDIILSDYTSVDKISIKELKFESVTAGTTVYLDNIYFVKEVDASMAMNAPVTFETGEHGASWTFANFENGTGPEGYEKVTNPNASGINTSATVGKYTATVAGAPWAGCKTNDIGKFTLDTKNSLVKIMVYKTVISDVALKFAVADGGSLGEIKVKNTKINEWEELSFEFYNQIGKIQSTDIVTMMISLDYQARSTENVSYFDNITFSKTSVPSPVLVCDAVLTEASQGSFTTGYKANFETVGTDVNIAFELLDAKDGLVVGLWKESPFEETAMVNDPAGSKIFKAKLTGQKAGSLISYACKFAYAGGQSVTKYIKYEVGTACSGTPPIVTGPKLPLDFETGTFAFVDFDGGAAITVANPNKTGINTTTTVAKMVKGAGQPWAGSKLKMASPVDFSTKKIIKVKVWSPVAGKKLLLKFEGAGAAFEKEAATTAANTWEELTFDYTGVAGVNNLNDNMVFIFDLGTVGDGSVNSTYYFDEITQPVTTPPVVTGPTLPLDFETGTFAFVGFDGGATTTIANPNKTGINTTATVAKMIKGAGQPWGGSKLTLATPVDFSTKKIFKVKVWSPVAGKKLLLKFESPNGNFEKESAGVTAANTWEELTFDFSNVSTTNTASDMVFIFDLGTAGDGSANSTYLFDEITQSAGSVAVSGATLPLDFEAATYAFVDFDGGVTTKVTNPQSNGINTSANVAKMVKGAGAMWAGSKIKMATPVDFSTNKIFKVKVWSPVAGKKLLLKFEGTAGNFEQESTGVTTANTWEELTFDFTKVGTNNVADFMVFIFDFGTIGDGSANSTYYFDDVKQASIPVAPSTNYLVSFETGSVVGTWDSFENPGQTGFEFASNPSKTGINTSDKVGKFTAVPTGQRWAGCETTGGSIGTWELDATSTTVTMMVYKSVISPVGIKMATSYNGTTFEIKKNNTKINEWELMTFDISPFIKSGDATQINKFVVFPDFRSDTDPVRNADVVLYFDDIKFSAKKLFDPNYVAPPVDNPTVAAPIPPVRNAAEVKSIFSDSYAVYKEGNWCQCWGQSTVVSDVVIVAGDKVRKLENFTYQGITLPDGEVFNVLDMNKVHIDLWFNDAKSISLALVQQTPGGSVEAALKFTPTKTGWNSFDVDLNSTTMPGVDLSKVFQMKLTSEKQGSNVFLDNFYFWKDAATVLAQMDLPVTFDNATVDYSLLGFGGAEGSTVVIDPTLATNKVAKVVKPAVSETWAGTTISAAAGLGFKNKIPFSISVTKMSVRIWSPDAGTIVRLKVEDHADKNHTIETESTVTNAKGWETIVFDFAKPVSGTAAMNLAYNYDKATIFFGFGSNGTEKIYYFDDVKMVEIAKEPVLSYGVTAQIYPLGKPIYPLSINNSGGLVPVNGYSISPALPAGLSFDTTTAAISGTPSTLTLSTLYTVTGTNSLGSGSTTISLNVVRDFKSNNFTIETTGETCLGEKNGEINIKAVESHTYIAIINDKSYEFTTNSLRVFNLAPGIYTISISVKGESSVQSFTAVVPQGSTITGKTSKSSYNKLKVVMTEGTAPYKVYLDGEEQFETPFSTFTLDVNKESLLEVKTAKVCEGTYAKNIEGILYSSSAYPNPTSGSFEIAIPTIRKEVVIDLYTLNSVFISSKSYPLENGVVRLSLEGQTAGIYIVKVYLDTPSYLKIIKK
ncbi:putative Ig domain-containing protein [Flavobacterium praedii]|uniref:putative Ig domain-containing protein n=1 Tax=Flavobacterium praedii TaxID=3002900 RepID=UPI002481C3AD|nr:putative Ig domain-containing protein [Flavobacterium praedii]